MQPDNQDPPENAEAARFFDGFVEAFASFSGRRIAARYAAPYLALHADGSTNCLLTREEIAAYFQEVVDRYRARGCRACRYRELEAVPIGSLCILGTVTWDLLHEDGSVLGSWRESYNLLRSGEGLRVLASIDHAK